MNGSSCVVDGSVRGTRTSSRKSSPQSLIGSAALALVVGGCVWTVYANVFGASVFPSGVRSNVEAAAQVTTPRRAPAAAPSFADRFDPAASAPLLAWSIDPAAQPAASSPPAPRIAWFDPAHSLGQPAGTFVKPAPIAPPVAVAQVMPQKPLAVAPQPPAVQIAQAPKPSELRVPTPAAATSHEALVRKARAVLLAGAPASKVGIFEKLFGASEPAPQPQVLAYAGPDGGVFGDGRDAITSAHPSDRVTAIYDITAKKVHMPDGSKLEAHSGLGNRRDQPGYVHERMRGATPPHVYDLKPREALFHGVAALRMTPVGGERAIHGRNGLLTHTYMLGPGGDSNGCISFKDYDAFLRAYRTGQVKRIIVVGSL